MAPGFTSQRQLKPKLLWRPQTTLLNYPENFFLKYLELDLKQRASRPWGKENNWGLRKVIYLLCTVSSTFNFFFLN